VTPPGNVVAAARIYACAALAAGSP
jgi:hypothetical protein